MRSLAARLWFRFLCWLLVKTDPTYRVMNETAFLDLWASVLAHSDFIDRSGFFNGSGYHAGRKLRRGVTDLCEKLAAVTVEAQ